MGVEIPEPARWLVPWLLVSLRVGVALALLPAPFGNGAPLRVRAAASLLFGWTLSVSGPWAGDPAFEALLDPWRGVRAAVTEVWLGAIVGLTARVALAAAELAGSWMGFSAGLGFAQSVDPAFGEASTPVGRLTGAFAVVLFFVFEGHHTVLRALAATLRFAPPGLRSTSLEPWGVLGIGADLFARGLQIAAPVVATLFLVQVGTALVSRAASRLQLFALTFAIASGVGLLVLQLAAPAMAPALGESFRRLPRDMERAFSGGP